MPTVSITKINCPNCRNTLKHGFPHFGAPIVRCSSCKTMIRTGLTPWKNLTIWGKMGNIFLEIITPGYFGQNVHPLFLIGAIAGSSAGVEWTMIMLVILLLISIIQIVNMISESNKYSDDNTLPEW